MFLKRHPPPPPTPFPTPGVSSVDEAGIKRSHDNEAYAVTVLSRKYTQRSETDFEGILRVISCKQL